jgi:hypothetical protein
MLMHGEEVPAIEAALEIDFSALVDHMGTLAWTAIVNQFIPVLLNKRPSFLRTSQYVHMNMSGAAHMQVGFAPNFDNPDPIHFPKVEFSMIPAERQPPEPLPRAP